MMISPALKRKYERRYNFDELTTREVVSAIIAERYPRISENEHDKKLDAAMKQRTYLTHEDGLKC